MLMKEGAPLFSQGGAVFFLAAVLSLVLRCGLVLRSLCEMKRGANALPNLAISPFKNSRNGGCTED